MLLLTINLHTMDVRLLYSDLAQNSCPPITSISARGFRSYSTALGDWSLQAYLFYIHSSLPGIPNAYNILARSHGTLGMRISTCVQACPYVHLELHPKVPEFYPQS